MEEKERGRRRVGVLLVHGSDCDSTGNGGKEGQGRTGRESESLHSTILKGEALANEKTNMEGQVSHTSIHSIRLRLICCVCSDVSSFTLPTSSLVPSILLLVSFLLCLLSRHVRSASCLRECRQMPQMFYFIQLVHKKGEYREAKNANLLIESQTEVVE